MLASRLRESRMPSSNLVQHPSNEFQLPTSVNPMFDQEACLLGLRLQVQLGVTEQGTLVPLHCKRSRVNSRLQILGAEPAGSVRGTATVYCSQQQVLSSCIRLLSLLSELFPVHKFTIITTAFVLLAIFHFLKVLPLHRDEQWNSYDATVDAIARFCISPDDGNTWC